MASVKFYLSNPKVNGKLTNKECLIVAMFTLSRVERFKLNTKEKIQPKFWDFKTQCAKSSAPDSIQINLYLSEFRRDLITLYRENRNLAFDDFKVLATTKQKKTLREAITVYLTQIESEKSSLTLKSYRKALGHFEPFSARDINTRLYDDLKASLLSEGKRDSTVYKYLKIIKNFLKWCSKRGHEVGDLSDWKIKERESEVISLTLAELEQLENCILPNKILSIARDYLVAECRTGQRISDIKNFDLRDLQDGVWTITQKKGRRLNPSRVHVPLVGYCAKFLDILSKYNYQMPAIAEQTINKNVKTVCRIANIDSIVTRTYWRGGNEVIETKPKHRFITTHTGRKTFVTLALQYLPEKIVRSISGIKSYKTLKRYDGQADINVLSESLYKMAEKMKNVS